MRKITTLLLMLMLLIPFATNGQEMPSVQGETGLMPNSIMISVQSDEQEPVQRISVHDPVMMKQDGVYYLFCTGNGISVFSSTDMKEWKREERIFAEAPKWAVEAVPGFRGHIWAPDIAYYNGQYHIYYSVSAFGKNTSAMGVATNKTLHPSSPDFKWVDHGKVIQSYPGVTNWNAIDANFITDKKGTPYLTWGSFWDGLQIIKLSPDGLSVGEDINGIKTIVSRKSYSGLPNPPSIDNNPVDAGGNAVEAPFIFKKGKYFYMFASIDYCCKGVNSSYKMIIGRSKKVTGPYLDKEKKNLAFGGGTILMQGDENWHGVGHNATVSFDGVDYLVFHAYDAKDNGRSKLRIFKLDWDKNGWPVVGEPVY
jgi:arabinan endo-1,5-alpha-L-arabinosidase